MRLEEHKHAVKREARDVDVEDDDGVSAVSDCLRRDDRRRPAAQDGSMRARYFRDSNDN